MWIDSTIWRFCPFIPHCVYILHTLFYLWEQSDESGNKKKLSGIVSYGSKAEKEEAMKRKQKKQAQRRLQVGKGL